MEHSKSRVNRAGDWLRDCLMGKEPWDEDRVNAEIEIMVAWRDEHAYPLKLCIPGLRNWVDAESSVGISPVQRLKRAPRMLEKLRRHPGMKLARMQDIGGARAVLGTLDEVDVVADRIRTNWTVIREVDYRETPREDTGYRALHVMVEKRERVVEVQLRTESQQRWADEIERTDSRLGYALKDGEGPPDLVEYFRMASDLLYIADSEAELPADFNERFSAVREKVRPYFGANPES